MWMAPGSTAECEAQWIRLLEQEQELGTRTLLLEQRQCKLKTEQEEAKEDDTLHVLPPLQMRLWCFRPCPARVEQQLFPVLKPRCVIEDDCSCCS